MRRRADLLMITLVLLLAGNSSANAQLDSSKLNRWMMACTSDTSELFRDTLVLVDSSPYYCPPQFIQSRCQYSWKQPEIYFFPHTDSVRIRCNYEWWSPTDKKRKHESDVQTGDVATADEIGGTWKVMYAGDADHCPVIACYFPEWKVTFIWKVDANEHYSYFIRAKTSY